MSKKAKYRLIKTSICGVLLATTITGCAKEMDCNISGEHVHMYVNPETGLSKYIDSEKETKFGGLYWTNNIKRINRKTELMVENDLCIVSDNIEYLTNTISKYSPRRFAYVYDYRSVSTYGYRYGYNISSGKYEYSYGPINEYRWTYDWEEIPLDYYTEDKVKDLTYKFRFYKIDENGTITPKLFDSLEEVEPEYNYFKLGNLVEEIYSNSYYLENSNVRTKK